ncbi:mitochondrial ribosomal subunit S27-domain-containing protein [Coprinopsis sp. MPI-PUGE-AT-0042]|nr:mitochondrial ribosomal subunit S27-domain-containing protein [Coprinopsis sp. MPI-PUGE-AT-0042]
MSVAAPSRLAALTRLRCEIFQTTYNPQAVRTGAKYLKRKLQGPAITSYYPSRLSIPAIQKRFPELELVDEDEVERMEDVIALKKRGKGAPKKARTKEESRRLKKKR